MSSAHDEVRYDPDRHDNQIVAVFEHRRAADRARDALLDAGVSDSAIEVLDADPGASPAGGHSGETGIWGATRNLFAPEQDRDDYRHALGLGHAMVVVTPLGGADRHRAVELLEAAEPLDFDAKRAEWRERAGSPVTMNRATVTRADLVGKEPPGRDAVMLDMTGQPMQATSMSAEDMQATAEFSEHDPARHPQSETTAYTANVADGPLHEVNSLEDRTVHGPRAPATDPRPPAPPLSAPNETAGTEPQAARQTTYTHGVPPEVASELSPEQQVQLQQPARAESVRVVEERIRTGRREQPPGAVRVRSYVAERDPASQFVRLEEEQIGKSSRT